MPEVNNSAPQRLTMEEGAARLMGNPSEEAAPEGTTATEEVTETEESKNTIPEPSLQLPVGSKEQPEEAEESEEESEDPDGESEEEAEEDDAEDDSEDESEDEDEAVSDDPNQVLWHDAEGNPVTREEAQRGYMRQDDYTRKTQALSEGRKQLQQAAESFVQERNQVAETLSLALNVIEPEVTKYADVDWDRLSVEDSYKYSKMRQEFERANARLQAVQNRGRELLKQQQAYSDAQLKQRKAVEQKRLAMAIPELNDATKRQAFGKGIAEYARDVLKLSPQEFSGIVDHRMFVVMDKARRYDALQQGTLDAAKKKISKAPNKSMRSGKPTSRNERKAKARQEQYAKLKQSGKMADAIELLMSGRQ